MHRCVTLRAVPANASPCWHSLLPGEGHAASSLINWLNASGCVQHEHVSTIQQSHAPLPADPEEDEAGSSYESSSGEGSEAGPESDVFEAESTGSLEAEGGAGSMDDVSGSEGSAADGK